METKTVTVFLERSNNENVLAVIFDGAKEGMQEAFSLLEDAIQDIKGIRFMEFGAFRPENILVKFDHVSWRRIVPHIKESFIKFFGKGIEFEEIFF